MAGSSGGGFGDFLRNIPFVGGAVGNTLLGPDMSGMEAAVGDAKDFYTLYAPQNYAARQQALGQAMQLFQPVNSALTQMYGEGAALPPEQQASLFQLPEPVASSAPYGTGPVPTVGVPGAGGVPNIPGKTPARRGKSPLFDGGGFK